MIMVCVETPAEEQRQQEVDSLGAGKDVATTEALLAHPQPLIREKVTEGQRKQRAEAEYKASQDAHEQVRRARQDEVLIIETSIVLSPMMSRPSTPGSSVSDRVHICEHCHKCFNRRGKLEDHLRTHTGERPFACPVEGCGKTYMRSAHLTSHMRTHDEGLKRAFKCTHPGCTAGFATKQHLNRHFAIHETPKPFK
ncbi:hypothetical protein EV182_004168, partial [Spiromyces aspiralis]